MTAARQYHQIGVNAQQAFLATGHRVWLWIDDAAFGIAHNLRNGLRWDGVKEDELNNLIRARFMFLQDLVEGFREERQAAEAEMEQDGRHTLRPGQ